MKTKFAIIADLHFGPAKYDTPEHRAVEKLLPEIIKGVVDKINAIEGIEFVINLGDLVQEFSAAPSREQDLESASKAMAVLNQLKKPLYHVVGNHDIVTLSKEDLRTIFGHELYYSFETNEYRHIALQCESPAHFDVHLVEGETDWLKTELADSQKPVIVHMHQMLVEHPLEGTSCEGIPGCAYVRNKQEVKDILLSSGKVRGVVNGHLHHNLFKTEMGIPYLSVQALTEPGQYDGGSLTAEAFAVVEVSDDSFSAWVHGNDPATYHHAYQ